jgi:hypothetical protein
MAEKHTFFVDREMDRQVGDIASVVLEAEQAVVQFWVQRGKVVDCQIIST